MNPFLNRIDYINSMTNTKLENHHTRLHGYTTGFCALGVRANNSDADGDAMMPSPDANTGDKTHSNSKLLVHNLMTGARHNDQLLSLSHEQAYALWAISRDVCRFPINPNHIEDHPMYGVDSPSLSLHELSQNYRMVVDFGGVRMSYLLACFNDFVMEDLEVIEEDLIMDKNWTSDLLLKYYDPLDYTVYLELIFRLHIFTNILTSIISEGNLLFTLKDFAFEIPDIDTVQHEIVTGVSQQQKSISDIIDGLDEENTFKKMLMSKVGLKTAQFSVLFRKGYATNLYSQAVINNATRGLSKGLDPIDYWLSSEGARAATKAKESAIPKAGEMLRFMYFGTGLIKNNRAVSKCTCDAPKLMVNITKKTILKYYNTRTILFRGEDRYLDIEDPSTYRDIPNGKYPLYGPTDCNLGDYETCQRCSAKVIEDTYYHGLLASSLISEAIIQSSLSSHHTSGSYNLNISDRLNELIRILNPVEDSSGVITFKDYNASLIEEYITEVKGHYESTEDIDMSHDLINQSIEFKLNVTPEAEDATKALKNILRYINVNQKASTSDYLGKQDTYDGLYTRVLEANGLYSIYLELIMMLLFLDDDGELVQYSGKPEFRKIPISKVIDNLTSINGLMYNFSNQKLKAIQTNLGDFKPIHHAYDEMFKFYEPSRVTWLGK